jgi:hypothetical protein
MTPIDMIFLLRQHLSDEQNVGWPDDSELVAFLDRAGDLLSEQLIADRDPAMMLNLRLDGEITLPDDFVAFAGNAPAVIVGRLCQPYYDFPLDILYWGKMPHMSALNRESETPYTRERALLIVDIARLFALNKNEYDIAQDLTLLGEIKNTMKGARANGASGG